MWCRQAVLSDTVLSEAARTHPPLSIASYSFIQLCELEQCRVKTLAQGFNTAAQDSNPGSRSRESEALPLSLCAHIDLGVIWCAFAINLVCWYILLHNYCFHFNRGAIVGAKTSEYLLEKSRIVSQVSLSRCCLHSLYAPAVIGCNVF